MSLEIFDKKLKISNYNHFLNLKGDGKYLVFNSISNSLAKIDEKIYHLLQCQKDSELSNSLKEISDHEIINQLYDGNIIIDEDYDEIEFLRLKFNQVKFGLRTLVLTIVPTSACNLDCVYCYEGNKKKNYMQADTEEAISKFVLERIDKIGYKSIHVTWFGGEPLMNMRSIYSISKKLKSICKAKKLHYDATVVTNGTLLNKKIANNLKKNNVSNIQITLDGPKEIHDIRRPFINPKGSSYEVIIQKIAEVKGIVPITIRINVDKTNIKDVPKLLKEFNEKGWLDSSQNIYVYIGYTREWTSECSNILPNCFSMKEFSEEEIKFQEILSEQGFEIGNLYPSLTSYCVAVSPHGFVIEPGGEYHKCWSNVGNKDKFIGNIRDELEINQKALKWLKYDALDMFEECKSCNLFPICGGGCPYVGIEQNEKLNEDKNYNCTPWKLLMEKKINLFLTQKSKEIK